MVSFFAIVGIAASIPSSDVPLIRPITLRMSAIYATQAAPFMHGT